ncbi:hypothetical protein [Alteribacter natronophilus]|uniref:hypothetical protein n=1 Tax=Alteribacter natronophilus TaxID=2583810 RepID=UPI00110EDEB5|nr:hypothetical protein [Alteribacter natronophilus]TMW71244.1 hypothetical protein FGB90_14945 [Alteribacter natronophilus]
MGAFEPLFCEVSARITAIGGVEVGPIDIFIARPFALDAAGELNLVILGVPVTGIACPVVNETVVIDIEALGLTDVTIEITSEEPVA